MYIASLERSFNAVFRNKFNVIAMVHVGGFPGSPKPMRWAKVIQRAMNETKIFKSNNCDGILLENLYDAPYRRPREMTPEVVACMTHISNKVKRYARLPTVCGIQILAGCNQEALAVAEAASLCFIRAEGLLYSHIGDEGFIDGSAATFMRYKKQLNSKALVLADIKKKYCSHAITADVDITEMVHAAENAGVDAVVLTGKRTGDPVNLDEFHRVRECTKIPVIIGSGVTIDNVQDYIDADGVIVGTHFKVDGDVMQTVCPERVKAFMTKVNELRGTNTCESSENNAMNDTDLLIDDILSDESSNDSKAGNV